MDYVYTVVCLKKSPVISMYFLNNKGYEHQFNKGYEHQFIPHSCGFIAQEYCLQRSPDPNSLHIFCLCAINY